MNKKIQIALDMLNKMIDDHGGVDIWCFIPKVAKEHHVSEKALLWAYDEQSNPLY
jgi:hypothetical protein